MIKQLLHLLKRVIQRKRKFDEISTSLPSVVPQSSDELFRIEYFLCIVDQAITSLTKRFEQYQEYEKIFGFLFNPEKWFSLDDMTLNNYCSSFANAFKKGENFDVSGDELFIELKLLREVMPKEIVYPIDILNYLMRANCFPSAIVAYRILLTIPVTVASAERSFSKLKLLKSYLRTTMIQERLNGLAMIAIENDILEKIKFDDLVDDFASKKARRIALFR